MKQLGWCIVGIVFAALVSLLSGFAATMSASLLAHPPSASWLPLARYLFAVWLIYGCVSLLSLIFLWRQLRGILKDKEVRNVPIEPGVPLLATAAIVAGSSLLFPAVTGYGTILFQWITFGSLALIAKVTSNVFAEQHHMLLWTLALFLNACVFLIPAGIIRALLGRRWPHAYAVILIGWALFYLGSLFILFPAGDGP